jgi:hypothetical protein
VVQKIAVTMVDDVTGKESADVKTVGFSVRGIAYEIDLSDVTEQAFDKAIARYVSAARKVKVGQRPAPSRQGGKGGTRPATRNNGQYEPDVVREWARSAGVPVAERGRIPRAVVEQWRASR